MALTFTRQKEGVVGDLRYWSGTITFDDSYPTGGEAITANNFGFGSTIYLVDLGADDGLNFQWDRANSKIMVFFPTGGSQSSPTTVTAPVAVIAGGGSSAIASTTLTITTTPGIGKEVGSTCNLSSVVIQVFVLGQ